MSLQMIKSEHMIARQTNNLHAVCLLRSFIFSHCLVRIMLVFVHFLGHRFIIKYHEQLQAKLITAQEGLRKTV